MSPSSHLKIETDPVSETLFFSSYVEFRTLDEVHKPSDSECYTPPSGPPLWSSGQSSWLQIRRPGFDSLHYQKKNVVGLERGALSLVSTN
jgi:hypothetical protein